MDRGSDSLAYRRLRAPRENGGALVEPPPSRFAPSLAANRLKLAAVSSVEVGGERLGQLQLAARKHLVTAALQYSSTYLDSLPTASDLSRQLDAGKPVVLTGHQPQLFHPGVWFKNFVLGQLASRTDAIAVNLIIDNDTARTASIRVPTGEASAPLVTSVPLDSPSDEVPFEERPIRDRDLFESFAERTIATLGSLVPDPLVSSLWPAARASSRRTDRLGLCLSQARHQLEYASGVRLLDVPLGVVCDSDPFRRFLLGLVENAARFRHDYNSSLVEYRRLHRIRSRSHPVPELASEGDWTELPFWVWTSESPRRRRLFTRLVAGGCELSDHAAWRLSLPLQGAAAWERASSQLEEQRLSGLKIRPRALATTLYARLILGDHFVHGIGGAKYDQLTDSLFARFFGVDPPEFVTATATLCLPIAHPRVTMEEVRELAHRIREFDFHPELWLSERQLADSYVANLVDEKRRWVQMDLPRGARLTRHRAIGAINETLLPMVENRRHELRSEWEQARLAAQRHSMLASREFSYCLFPVHKLVDGLLALSARTA
ncbi:MAG: hypothetical protein U1A77_24110 [Pirellulales bacterium]